MRSRLGLNRSQWLLALVMAIILVVVAYFQNQAANVEPYDPSDSGSNGLRALVLWLEQLHYPVTIGVPGKGMPAGPGLLVISPNNPLNVDYSSDDGGDDGSNGGTDEPTRDANSESNSNDSEQAQVDAYYKWVEDGGTLILVGPTIPYEPLSVRFGVQQLNSLTNVVSDIRQVQPLLPDIVSDYNPFLASYTLDFMKDPSYGVRAIVPVLSHANGDPAVALQYIGKGVVWHMTEDFAFTNLNLRDTRIAALLPAILRTVPAGAPVVISTSHLMNYNQLESALGEVTTLQDWLYTTPFGQATLLVIVALFIYLIFQGRRLGPALAGPSATRPREAAEYVSALAGLQRRTRHPADVADHHRQRLKSAVGRLAQVPADLPDSEWLAHVRKSETILPAQLAEATELLTGYAYFATPAHSASNNHSGQKKSSKGNDEADLIHLVQATDALVATLPRANTQLVR